MDEQEEYNKSRIDENEFEKVPKVRGPYQNGRENEPNQRIGRKILVCPRNIGIHPVVAKCVFLYQFAEHPLPMEPYFVHRGITKHDQYA